MHRCHSRYRPLRPFVLLALGIVAVLCAPEVRVLSYASVALAGLFWLATAIPFPVTVDSEGLTISRFGFRRFVPWRSIESVNVRREEGVARREDEEGHTVHLSVRLRLTSGRAIELGTGTDVVPSREGTDGATNALTRALVRDVEQGLAKVHAHAPTALEKQLSRGARTVSEWLAALKQLARRDETYRSAPLDKQALFRVLEDPAAEPTARAGAAVVLKASLDPDDAPRLRAAAESCEAPRLRVALEQATDGDEEADYERALGAIE